MAELIRVGIVLDTAGLAAGVSRAEVLYNRIVAAEQGLTKQHLAAADAMTAQIHRLDPFQRSIMRTVPIVGDLGRRTREIASGTRSSAMAMLVAEQGTSRYAARLSRLGFAANAALGARGAGGLRGVGMALISLAPNSAAVIAGTAGAFAVAAALDAITESADEADERIRRVAGRVEGLNPARLFGQTQTENRTIAALERARTIPVTRWSDASNEEARAAITANLSHLERWSFGVQEQIDLAIARIAAAGSATRGALSATATNITLPDLDIVVGRGEIGPEFNEDQRRRRRKLLASNEGRRVNRAAPNRFFATGSPFAPGSLAGALEGGKDIFDFPAKTTQGVRDLDLSGMKVVSTFGELVGTMKEVEGAASSMVAAFPKPGDLILAGADALSAGFGSFLDALAQGQNAGKAFFGSLLRELARYARTQAVIQLAEGFAALFLAPPKAAAHFKSAALFGAGAVLAGAAGGGGGGVAGGAGASSRGGLGRGGDREANQRPITVIQIVGQRTGEVISQTVVGIGREQNLGGRALAREVVRVPVEGVMVARV